MSTIKQVAARAKVSIATVSRVLRGSPHIRPELRERVLEAVEALGYRPNSAASQLRSRKSATIGLVVADIRNPFFAAVSRAAEDVAAANHFNLFLCNTGEDPEKEREYLEVLSAQQVAGVVLSPTAVTAGRFAELPPTGRPMVIIDREVPGADIDQIGIDNTRAAAEATEHLLASGRRRIAALFGNASSTGVARHAGFLQAHAARGVPVDASLVHFLPPHPDDGFERMARLLSSARPPDAVFASNGALAGGVARAIHQRGLRIGEEIALACFDHPDWIDILGLPVHVVEQPTDEIGRMAVTLILRRLEEPTRPARRLILQHKLRIAATAFASGA